MKIAWKPMGTRWGSLILATGVGSMVFAFQMQKSAPSSGKYDKGHGSGRDSTDEHVLILGKLPKKYATSFKVEQHIPRLAAKR